MHNQPEVGFQQLGLVPFTQRLDMPPSTLPAPSSCGPELLAASLPHLFASALREEKYHQGRLGCR